MVFQGIEVPINTIPVRETVEGVAKVRSEVSNIKLYIYGKIDVVCGLPYGLCYWYSLTICQA